MDTEVIPYQADGITALGYAVYNSKTKQKRPAVLIAHAWRGQDDFAKEKARELAELGYFGFAIDMYGDGLEVKSDKEAAALMVPLFIDRRLLRNRVVAAFETL